MANNLREAQKKEALKRLKMLKLHTNVVNDFESGVINVSVRHNNVFDGVLYWLDSHKEWMDAVANFEREFNALVYHAQLTNFEFGMCLSMLFVSQHRKEWKLDRNDIKDVYEDGSIGVYAYVHNIDCPDCSEIGKIGLINKNGGLSRVW